MDFEDFSTFSLFPSIPSARPTSSAVVSESILGPYSLDKIMRIVWLLKDVRVDLNWSYTITESGQTNTYSGILSAAKHASSEWPNYCAHAPAERLCSNGDILVLKSSAGTFYQRVCAPFFWNQYDVSTPMDEREYGVRCVFEIPVFNPEMESPFSLSLLLRKRGETQNSGYTVLDCADIDFLGTPMSLCLYAPDFLLNPDSGYNFSSFSDISYSEEYFVSDNA